MGTLVYTGITSLDGFINDADGRFEFAHPDAAVHAFVNELDRPVGTYLYGRRLYETMAGWETMPALAAQSSLAADFSDVWKAPRKIVYSTTLTTATTTNTTIERAFDADAVRRLKSSASSDLTVGGANLAAQALAAGLVDYCILFVWPMTVGDGKPALPADASHRLELIDERRFANGTLLLRYRVAGQRCAQDVSPRGST